MTAKFFIFSASRSYGGRQTQTRMFAENGETPLKDKTKSKKNSIQSLKKKQNGRKYKNNNSNKNINNNTKSFYLKWLSALDHQGETISKSDETRA